MIKVIFTYLFIIFFGGGLILISGLSSRIWVAGYGLTKIIHKRITFFSEGIMSTSLQAVNVQSALGKISRLYA